MAIEALACPECGGEVPSDAATRGLCPRCLMRRALAGIEETPAFAGVEGTTPRVCAPALDPAELAGLFQPLEILELLGQGGMGAVYMARQKGLQRLVALKVIPRALAADPAFVERFHREARALARLSHPNIVAAYDFGQVDDHCFLVMEYVAGQNLRQAMRSGPLAPAEALAVAAQVCDALQYAHQQGIVHRDIKPENILLEAAANRVKIADFGLARLLEPEPGDFTLTEADHVLGTPQYMAPEQIERPRETDHRADVYSLGVVLYEMLTGELPLGRFDPPSQRLGRQGQGNASPAPVEGAAEADEGPSRPTSQSSPLLAIHPRQMARLDTLVLRCLEKDPARRCQSAREVKDELDPLCAWFADPTLPKAGRAPARRRRWSVFTVAAALLAILMAGDLGWQIVEKAVRRRAVTQELPPPDEDPAVTAGTFPAGPAEKPEKPEGPEPVMFRAVPGPSTAGPFFRAIQLSAARLAGDGKQLNIRVEFHSSMGMIEAGATHWWVVESEHGWTEQVRLGWRDLGRDGTLRHSFVPPASEQGPWETYIEIAPTGIGASRQRVSNVIRFEPQESPPRPAPAADTAKRSTGKR